MWEQLRRFSQLNGSARGVFLRAAALLPFISASLRFRGFRQTQSFLQKLLSGVAKQAKPSFAAEAELTARMVRAAVRHSIGHPTCLEESLVLWWLLARQKIAADLRIGVRKAGEKMEAHAWVECQGAVLNAQEEMHKHFAPFDAAFSPMPESQ